ncbi:MAG: phosphoglycerate dehydrogenase [Candidatus Omnitrophica bacterium]|nr:phosphoglycerate dehydrogenase [Candidatus Omnitrophota bacterium]
MADQVFISTSSFAKFDLRPLELLRTAGYDVQINPYGRKMQSAELAELARDAIGLIAGTETLDAETIEGLQKIRVISRCGVGVDNVDHTAAAHRHIKVFNTPDAPTIAVAELTVGLVLDCLRNISRLDRGLRAGEWNKVMGRRLSGKTVGIIGYGRIGRKVASLLHAFGCKILCHDPFSEHTPGAQRMELSELLHVSDIVTIHCSTPNEILGTKELSNMKADAILINVARGGNVNEDELYVKLKAGKLAGAALDVFSSEPYHGKLIELDNIVLTTHVGSYARESRIQMEVESVQNLIKGLEC